jgi:hypothetical protein
VKQQGPAKGFDFDVSKVEQIFNLLLKEKQLSYLKAASFLQHKSCKGDHIASGIILSLTTLATVRNYVG